MPYKVLKNIMHIFRATPFHPQWLIFRHEKNNLVDICAGIKSSVLDIGCADKKPKVHLPDSVYYVGLDYYTTAMDWYNTTPNIYGDAQQLPLKDSSFDNVLLLDVLEHLPDPVASIKEIHRVLKPSGKLIIQVPFIYPIHDAPLDFHRWTLYGLRNLAESENFKVLDEKYFGQPVETAFLMINLALSKITLEMLKKKNLFFIILLPVLPVVVVMSNLLSVVSSLIFPKDKFMPLGYRLLLVKNK